MGKAVAAIAAAAAIGAGLGAASVGAAPAPTSNVAAYLHGKLLPIDPIVNRNDELRIVVTGFAAKSAVTIRLSGSTTSSVEDADNHGVLSHPYHVPKTMPNGDYVMTFVGDAPAGSTPSEAPYSTSATYDQQGVTVDVPNVGIFPFRIRDPGTPSTSPTLTASISASETATNPGGVAHTGSNIAAPLLFALIAIVVGAVAVLLGVTRQRGRREPDQLPPE